MKISELRTADERYAYLEGAMAMHGQVMDAFDNTIGGDRVAFLDAYGDRCRALLDEISAANQAVHHAC